MKKTTQLLISIILNSALVILSCIGALGSIRNNGSLPASMVYYTQDSNIFLGISSLIYVIAACLAIQNRTYVVPLWVQRLKYLSISCIAVTLFVVIFILAPMASSIGGIRWLLFSGNMLYQHFLSPVIAIIGFLLFEKYPELAFRTTWIALIPTLIYASVIYPLNILAVVDGPYPFLQVHNMSVGMSVMWFFVVLALSYLLAFLIWLINRKVRIVI